MNNSVIPIERRTSNPEYEAYRSDNRRYVNSAEVDRRSGVGLSVGPTVSESYQLSGVVTALRVVERPLADVRVSALYQGEELASATTDVRGRFLIDVDRNPPSNSASGPSAFGSPPRIGPITGVMLTLLR